MRVLEAQAVISAHDRTGNTFQRIAGKMKVLENAGAAMNRRAAAIERSSAIMNRSSGVIAAAATRVMAPVALGYAAKRSFERFAETEMAITRIGITAGASEAEVASLNKTLRSLAYENAKPFDEVTSGLSELVSGGLDLPQALPAMPAIVKTAQAAGAEVSDIAKSSLALTQALGISTGKMREAFDVMVEGGKAGKFELKDMARYFPSIAPAAAAVGMKGEEGLKRLVAVLQVIRNGTGTVEEAASSASNIFAKMESEETVKRFQKFGVNLRQEMQKARKEGRDLLTVFTDLTEKAIKGDASKIPQLFSDMEFARGMRALVSYRKMLDEVRSRLNDATGATDRDLATVLTKSQSAINQLAEAWDRATASLGRYISQAGGSRGLKWIANQVEEMADKEEKQRQDAPKSIGEFRERYLAAKDEKRISQLDQSIAVAERDVAAAEATRRVSPLGRDPAQARSKLERLRTEREMLRLNMEARRITIPPPPVLSDQELQFIRDSQNVSVRLPRADPRRVPLPSADPRRSASFPPFGSMDETPTQVAERIRNSPAAPVEATLKGGADINVKVTVEPSADFFTRVRSMVGNLFGNLRVIGGAPETGTTGSTGRTMPETASVP